MYIKLQNGVNIMKKMQIIFRSLLTVAMLLSGGSMMAAAVAGKNKVRIEGCC